MKKHLTAANVAETKKLALSSLDRAYDRGDVEWIDGMPVWVAAR